MRFILPSLCLAAAGAASAINLSGTVTDASGHGISGVWVGLYQANVATRTASDGTWSLSGVSGIESHPIAERAELANHLVVDGGRLRLSLSGKDVSGRKVSATVAGSASVAGARETENVFDTILFGGDKRLFASLPVPASSQTGIRTTLDTSRKMPYRMSGDTIFLSYQRHLEADCQAEGSGSVFSIWIGGRQVDTGFLAPTATGLELTYWEGELPYIGKLTRTAGSASAIEGTYRLTQRVYRPAPGTVVPDSVRRFIADDSVRSLAQFSAYGYQYAFTADTITLTYPFTPAPGPAFLFDWNSSFLRWFDYRNSSWVDEGRFSDSAQFDPTAKLLDSSTVQLVGNATHEIVTVKGARGINGWGYDYTYSSSDPSHDPARATDLTTTCPNGPTWLNDFESANLIYTSSARKLSGAVVKPVRHRSFLEP